MFSSRIGLCLALAFGRNCVVIEKEVRQVSMLPGSVHVLSKDLDGAINDGYRIDFSAQIKRPEDQIL